MAQFERVGLILSAPEVTYGTDALPEPVDMTAAYAARMVDVADVEFNMLDKMRVRPTRASQGKNVGALYRKVELSFDLQGPADPGGGALPEPKFAQYLKACEMAVTSTGVPIDTHTYDFTTRESQESLTCKIYEFELGAKDAKELICLGARFAWEFSIGVNEPGFFKFTGCALIGSDPPERERTFTQPELDAVVFAPDQEETCDAANGRGMTLTYGGVVLAAKTIKITTNRKVELVEDVNGVFGYTAAYVTADEGATFTIEVDPLEDDLATLDHFTKILAESTEPLVVQADTAQGTRFTFNFPEAQLGEFGRDIDKNLVRLGFSIYAKDATDAGDDAMNLVVTRTP